MRGCSALFSSLQIQIAAATAASTRPNKVVGVRLNKQVEGEGKRIQVLRAEAPSVF